MTISIIIPVYNAEGYIEKMLESILNQERPEGLSMEVVLVENGSTDKSPSICDEYAEDVDFVSVWHCGKIGAFGARVEGMRKSKGQWLIFADADDLMAKGAIAGIYETISFYEKEGKAPDIVLYNAATVADPHKKMFDFPFEEGRLYASSEKEAFYEVMCIGDSLNAMWNKCVSRRLAEASQLQPGHIMNHGEDLLQTAEFLDRAESIAYVDKIFYLYREGSQGLTGAFHEEFMTNQIEAWEAFDRYAFNWTGDRFSDIIDSRKALTCSIGVESLIYSDLSLKMKRKKLEDMVELSFYQKYATKDLPKWAPDADVFVHGLQCAEDPVGELMKSAGKHDFKSRVKSLIGRK